MILLSPSSRKLAKSCNRKFVFNLLMKYNEVPRQNKGKAALTGNALHSIIEAWRLNFEDPVKFAKDLYPEIPAKSKDQHNWDFITLTFLAYKKNYPMEKENPILKIDSLGPLLETHWIDKTSVDKSLFPDQGFVDRIEYIPFINDNNQTEPFEKSRDYINIIDIKTSKEDVTSKNWYKKWSSDIQPALYMRYFRNLGYNINAFIIDGIQHTRKYRKFSRLILKDEYTEEKCKNIIDRSDLLVQSALENPTVANTKSCYEWGPCQYLPICNSNFINMKEEEMLNLFYETYNIQNPKDPSEIKYESKF